MQPFRPTILKPFKAVAFWVCLPILAYSGVGIELGENRYKDGKTIIYAEIIEIESGFYGEIEPLKDSDSPAPKERKRALLDRTLVYDFIHVRNRTPKHEIALYQQTNGKFTQTQLAEAKKKDEAAKQIIRDRLRGAEKKANLVFDPAKEYIYYYDSGKATVRITHSLKGDLKVGDTILVEWPKVVMQIACPPFIPVKKSEHLGFAFGESLKAGDSVKLGYSVFYGLEKAQTVKSKVEGKSGE